MVQSNFGYEFRRMSYGYIFEKSKQNKSLDNFQWNFQLVLIDTKNLKMNVEYSEWNLHFQWINLCFLEPKREFQQIYRNRIDGDDMNIFWNLYIVHVNKMPDSNIRSNWKIGTKVFKCKTNEATRDNKISLYQEMCIRFYFEEKYENIKGLSTCHSIRDLQTMESFFILHISHLFI